MAWMTYCNAFWKWWPFHDSIFYFWFSSHKFANLFLPYTTSPLVLQLRLCLLLWIIAVQTYPMSACTLLSWSLPPAHPTEFLHDSGFPSANQGFTVALASAYLSKHNFYILSIQSSQAHASCTFFTKRLNWGICWNFPMIQGGHKVKRCSNSSPDTLAFADFSFDKVFRVTQKFGKKKCVDEKKCISRMSDIYPWKSKDVGCLIIL